MKNIKCLIDEKEISIDEVSCSGMNFGQKVYGLKASRYELVITSNEFIKLMRLSYEKFVKENIEDEPGHEYGEFAEIDKLMNLRYPSIDELVIEYRDLFEIIVKNWLYCDLFAQIFPYRSLEEIKNIKHTINSVEKVKVNNEEVTIEGEVFGVNKNKIRVMNERQ